MQHKPYCRFLCCILLVTAACAPASTTPLAPTIPPPTATQPLPTVTTPPPTATQPLPTATTPPPTATPLPPTVTSVPPIATLSAIPPEAIAEIDAALSDMADKDNLAASVLISHRGTVLLSKGYGLADNEQKIPITPATRFRLGSVTKQFTAAAILLLQEQGKLKVSDPICSYLADCPHAWKDITIHHLLTHTSGIPDFTSLLGYGSTIATPSAPHQTIARFRDFILNFQPGKKWSYSNSGYIVLGYIIEQVSDQTYEEFLQDAIFTPLNLRDTGYDHNANGLAVGYSANGKVPATYIDMSIPYAAGALYSTVEDLYTWVNALFAQQLLSQPSLDEMFAPQVAIPDSDGYSYGYGWIIYTGSGRPFVAHAGGVNGFTAHVQYNVDDQVIVIVLSNREGVDLEPPVEMIIKELFGSQ